MSVPTINAKQAEAIAAQQNRVCKPTFDEASVYVQEETRSALRERFSTVPDGGNWPKFVQLYVALMETIRELRDTIFFDLNSEFGPHKDFFNLRYEVEKQTNDPLCYTFETDWETITVAEPQRDKHFDIFARKKDGSSADTIYIGGSGGSRGGIPSEIRKGGMEGQNLLDGQHQTKMEHIFSELLASLRTSYRDRFDTSAHEDIPDEPQPDKAYDHLHAEEEVEIERVLDELPEREQHVSKRMIEGKLEELAPDEWYKRVSALEQELLTANIDEKNTSTGQQQELEVRKELSALWKKASESQCEYYSKSVTKGDGGKFEAAAKRVALQRKAEASHPSFLLLPDEKRAMIWKHFLEYFNDKGDGTFEAKRHTLSLEELIRRSIDIRNSPGRMKEALWHHIAEECHLGYNHRQRLPVLRKSHMDRMVDIIQCSGNAIHPRTEHEESKDFEAMYAWKLPKRCAGPKDVHISLTSKKPASNDIISVHDFGEKTDDSAIVISGTTDEVADMLKRGLRSRVSRYIAGNQGELRQRLSAAFEDVMKFTPEDLEARGVKILIRS